jgi:hypothetical protein
VIDDLKRNMDGPTTTATDDAAIDTSADHASAADHSSAADTTHQTSDTAANSCADARSRKDVRDKKRYRDNAACIQGGAHLIAKFIPDGDRRVLIGYLEQASHGKVTDLLLGELRALLEEGASEPSAAPGTADRDWLR